MIKSMTGFASLGRQQGEATIGVTIRAVNHRYLDLQVRVPQIWSHLEARLRAILQARLSRGRVELNVAVQSRQVPAVDVELNEDVVGALATAFERAREAGLIGGPLAPGDLLRVPQALIIRERQADPDSPELTELGRAVEAAVDEATAELDVMRVREGAHLQADLESRRVGLGRLLDHLATAAEEGRVALESRLHERVGELAAEFQADPAAIAQEIVRYAARSDISEETVRFHAHLSQWGRLAESPEPCGRKLDFLLQEMNREVNTIGAKADGSRVSELIVEIKAELEKMREQVQNVE
jgi:uncharacterized protein (TIGR00255 family)